jgi:DNA-binding protein H-NS
MGKVAQLAMELDKMDRKQLEKLRGDVEKTLESLEGRRKSEARKAAEETARSHGYTLDDLLAREKTTRKSAPRYRNTADPQQTWTGRGRKPGWINEALESGRPIEDFEI